MVYLYCPGTVPISSPDDALFFLRLLLMLQLCKILTTSSLMGPSCLCRHSSGIGDGWDPQFKITGTCRSFLVCPSQIATFIIWISSRNTRLFRNIRPTDNTVRIRYWTQKCFSTWHSAFVRGCYFHFKQITTSSFQQQAAFNNKQLSITSSFQ